MLETQLNPSAFSNSSATPEFSLGTKAKDTSGNEYIYVQNHSSATAVSASHVATEFSGSLNVITIDSTGDTPNRPMGIGVGAIAVDYYGWLLTKGIATVYLGTTNTTTAGAVLVANTATTTGTAVAGSFSIGTLLTYTPLGVCLTTVTAAVTTVTTSVNLP